MMVKSADLADLNRCLLLDPSFETEYVWQMYIEEEERGTTISFRTVKLPRPMKVNYPRPTDHLVEDWQKGECFLVAEVEGEIAGYLDMTIQAWNQSGWINNLVVAPNHRRQGVGTALLKGAFRWAQEHRLRTITSESQTKNYPAISFYQKHGFLFCGFSDHYYTTNDIALFFARRLR